MVTETRKRELLVLRMITEAASALHHEDELVSHDRLVKTALEFGRSARMTADEVNVVLKKTVESIAWRDSSKKQEVSRG